MPEWRNLFLKNSATLAGGEVLFLNIIKEKTAPPSKRAPFFTTAPQGSCFGSTFFVSDSY